ncbi:hypothetical protein [uncultured Microbulbifer sp.]|uniref:hypothetical protein n=1 Tax=uncultured Microbulbifer sp. TaxID=348147 RepID=UPI0025F93FAC|nr:hypothetical protein [uncultured Microbulbifer sp.]
MAENTGTDNINVAENNPNRKQKSGLSRWAGIGVFAAVALPIVAAYGIFYTGIGMPDGTVNQGELLTPAHAVKDIQLVSEKGETLDLAAEAPKWRYLILGDEICAGECQKLLYTTRQVHIRLGDKAHRVERLLVTGQPLSALSHQSISDQHPRLRLATADQATLDQWLADSDHANLKRPSALLVDQNGFAMMVYDNRHTGNQLLKDIKRLLKYSYEQ